MRWSERIWRKQRIRRLMRETTELRETLELETSRRQGLQQDLLAANAQLAQTIARANLAEEGEAKALDRVGELLETRDRLMMERDTARDAVTNMGYGIHMIHGERLTHTSEHHYDADHDDQREEGELACAAACYAAPEHIFGARVEEIETGDSRYVFTELWPFDMDEDRRFRPVEGLLPPQTELRERRIHELAKAGSLIAAEIERIVRLGGPERTAAPGRRSVSEGLAGRVSEIGLCGIGGPGGHDCFRVKGHEGPHSWEGSVHLGPGPGRDR